MEGEAAVFAQIRGDYLNEVRREISGIDASMLGISLKGDEFAIPFFGENFTVGKNGVKSPSGREPSHAVFVILCKYLLLCPKTEPVGAEWLTYKDFKDAAPFVLGFANTALKPLAKSFSGKLAALETACKNLGGKPADIEISCSAAFLFPALPKVPLLLVFNDADEDFPASCSILFEKRAEKYLDMECLAMLGMALSARLIKDL